MTDDKIPYEIGVSHFKHLAKAQITGQTVGILKILFCRESLEILGVTLFFCALLDFVAGDGEMIKIDVDEYPRAEEKDP